MVYMKCAPVYTTHIYTKTKLLAPPFNRNQYEPRYPIYNISHTPPRNAYDTHMGHVYTTQKQYKKICSTKNLLYHIIYIQQKRTR